MPEERKVRLARPRGFCSGVKAAIDAVEKALEAGAAPVCVLHEIVHNEHVVESLRERGVRFIEKLSEAPPGATLIFSAHGVSEAVEREARALPLKIVDASCPLVKRLQRKARELEAEGFAIILIGHKEHKEIEGVLGRLKRKARVILSEADVDGLEPIDGPCACLSQTTLSADETAKAVAKLKAKYPQLRVAGDVCYATKDRQNATKRLCESCEAVVVVGSAKSSNSRRLREVAEAAGAKAFLVASAKELPEELLSSAKSLGVTAGASAPESLVEELIALLERRGFKVEREPQE